MIQKKRKKNNRFAVPPRWGRDKRVSFLKSSFSLMIYVFLGISLFGFLIFSNWRIHQRRAELISEIKRVESEIQLLDKKNSELNQGISNLSNENYLEEVAREKLGLKKPGEEVVVVVPALQEEKKVEEEKNKGFWKSFLEKLGI